MAQGVRGGCWRRYSASGASWRCIEKAAKDRLDKKELLLVRRMDGIRYSFEKLAGGAAGEE